MSGNKLWLSYAWVDNEHDQIDFIAQKLGKTGLEVRFDRTHLIPGQRLWTQIGKHIASPDESDAWALVVSRNSLRSEPCQEELAIALDRAHRTRGAAYPLIGIFLEPIERDLIPPAIRTRLYTDLSDPTWAERVKAAVERRPPSTAAEPVSPLYHKLHRQGGGYVIEVRPREGRWRRCVVDVPAAERELLQPIFVGTPGNPSPPGAMTSMAGETSDGRYFFREISDAATPTDSLFIILKGLPSEIIFGSQEERFEATRAMIETW